MLSLRIIVGLTFMLNIKLTILSYVFALVGLRCTGLLSLVAYLRFAAGSGGYRLFCVRE